jgi:hypothetical protein
MDPQANQSLADEASPGPQWERTGAAFCPEKPSAWWVLCLGWGCARSGADSYPLAGSYLLRKLPVGVSLSGDSGTEVKQAKCQSCELDQSDHSTWVYAMKKPTPSGMASRIPGHVVQSDTELTDIRERSLPARCVSGRAAPCGRLPRPTPHRDRLLTEEVSSKTAEPAEPSTVRDDPHFAERRCRVGM